MFFICNILNTLLFGELFLIKSPIGKILFDLYTRFCPTI